MAQTCRQMDWDRQTGKDREIDTDIQVDRPATYRQTQTDSQTDRLNTDR